MMHMRENIGFKVIVNPIDYHHKAGLLQFQQSLNRLKWRLLRTELRLIDTDHIRRRRGDPFMLKLSLDIAQAIRGQHQGGCFPFRKRPADNKASIGSGPLLALVSNSVLRKDKKCSAALVLNVPGEELHILRLLRLHTFRMNQEKRHQALSFHLVISLNQPALELWHRWPYQLIQRLSLLMLKVEWMSWHV